MEKYKYCNIGRARQLSSGGREGGREGKGGRQQRVSIAQKGETTHVKGDVPCGIPWGDVAFGQKPRVNRVYVYNVYIYNVYVYIIIFFTYIFIYLYIAFFCLKFISFFFSPFFFSRRDGDVDGRRGKREDVRSGFQGIFFFFSFARIKGRFPPLHGPRIYLILVLFFIFSLFFFFFFFYLYAQARHEESRRTRACFVTVITFFFLSLSLSLSSSRYHHNRHR